MICRNHVEVSEGVRRCARCMNPYCGDCLVELAGRPYCAVCKEEQLLDVRSGVDRARLALASNWRRFGAIFLDGLLTMIPMYAIMGVVMYNASVNETEPSPFLNLLGVPFAFAGFIYEGLMLQLKRGQTLGKMALKVRVVRPDGSPITPGQAWGRAAMKMIFGCIWFVDYAVAFFTEEKTTLHDLVATTRVVDAY